MKKVFVFLAIVAATVAGRAQFAIDTANADTAKAAQIIERYLDMVDFSRYTTDSVLCVVSYVVDNDSPTDTMTIYRWYMAPRCMRVEIWQNGKLQTGYYTDGTSTFRKFREDRREWARLTSDSFFDVSMSLDIRGALHDWRSRGAEAYFIDELDYEGHRVYRVFVTCPFIFDRFYYFEKESGLLFLCTEEDRLFGDAERTHNASRVDLRAWHEFVPVHEALMPAVESYRVGPQAVVIHHYYHYEAPQKQLFTKDYHKI